MIKMALPFDRVVYICEICGAKYSSRKEVEKCENNSELIKPDVVVGDVVHITRIWNGNVFRSHNRVSKLFYKESSHELGVELRQKVIEIVRTGAKIEMKTEVWNFGDSGSLTLIVSWKEFVLFRGGDLLKICKELDLPLPRELRISWWQKLKNYFN